jgi:hypothetical protein
VILLDDGGTSTNGYVDEGRAPETRDNWLMANEEATPWRKSRRVIADARDVGTGKDLSLPMLETYHEAAEALIASQRHCGTEKTTLFALRFWLFAFSVFKNGEGCFQ